MIELAIVRFGEYDFNQQTWIMSKIFLARSSFLVAAAIQILHSIFTFRYVIILLFVFSPIQVTVMLRGPISETCLILFQRL